jgi:hypothetical protein
MRVIINNIYANIEINYFGTFSERILIRFDETHPLYGNEFMTKYFTFKNKNTIIWGYDNKELQWQIIENPKISE